MDMRKLVGRNLARLRQAQKLTQEELAMRSGFSQQYLSDMERGLKNPTIITLYEIALALRVSHVALVEPDGMADGAVAQPKRRRAAGSSRSG
ncbi:transcriptional regulator, XRE family [Ancylobacter novellus DSM 506]|uniref:Transcriptional regulator, XRE family n=1 Tax=Ancylobacter novellus (strain ATCC 8093 / DSM 506 / JCM 20403 / CCM 1077 / IAM 12100 / NBRC 12443 / NCIMB 10456) TaxID=639283 RepID=D7A6G0_ANCN5|nr:helix-turn-helix transcriptional regulator [Ancylobacter novellus]ADH90158.1 transcriptional regulator, XRE family [Ancylobacter novellus DSM 506]